MARLGCRRRCYRSRRERPGRALVLAFGTWLRGLRVGWLLLQIHRALVLAFGTWRRGLRVDWLLLQVHRALVLAFGTWRRGLRVGWLQIVIGC